MPFIRVLVLSTLMDPNNRRCPFVVDLTISNLVLVVSTLRGTLFNSNLTDIVSSQWRLYAATTTKSFVPHLFRSALALFIPTCRGGLTLFFPDMSPTF
jgi:hypothetical protein